MDRVQSRNENYMNEEEYTLNLENDEDDECILNLEEDEDTLHQEKEDVMIQECNEVQSDSSSDVPHTSEVDTLTLKRFQQPYVDRHQSIERETEISYSKGLVPEEVGYSAVAENILNEENLGLLIKDPNNPGKFDSVFVDKIRERQAIILAESSKKTAMTLLNSVLGCVFKDEELASSSGLGLRKSGDDKKPPLNK
ncbi:uncharacterized protein LOC128174653 [Crassostrea angulata]|uniref:uncharacterized protein LOC128174653 n=1 Tax=Magallana angulata TaxID=2784310 RepID=UPI0022B16B24|nr:uncharacterized protein LOC128174653 [Crassostrea angulata]